MNIAEFVNEQTHKYYWEQDLNCASTTLRILAEYFGIDLNSQVFDAAIGMHGAGGYQAQCGLVEGALLFIGISARAKGIPDPTSIGYCRKLAEIFAASYGSLECKILRPQGFSPENPPHLCEELTCKAIKREIELISSWLEMNPRDKLGRAND
ncbi:MAG: C-GCAxxG-C-C family protein [Bacteroidota bacterium]|jgi:hypothetical protein